MDNNEMAKVLAEMQGWKRIRQSGSEVWRITEERKILALFYDPATDVSQAIEAVEAWRDKTGRHWDISSPVFGGDEKFYCAIYHLADGEDWARADTPAQAITEALVKAVSDG